MNQSNSLRKLEQILTEAVDNGDKSQSGMSILLGIMKLGNEAGNIMFFYELLNKAKEEAKSIRNQSNLDRYVSSINKLHELFAMNHLVNTQWIHFATEIESKGILNTLDALAHYFHTQNPKIILEEDFLQELNNEFISLSKQISNSSLSRELQIFLSNRIEDILTAIRRYRIDGTDGLERTIKSLISDLVMTESTLKDQEKKDPIFNKVRAWGLGILIWITPTPYDMIGAAPDIQDFWIPKFEELRTRVKTVEQTISESKDTLNIQSISSICTQESKKRLCGGEEQKSLPPSKEIQDTSNS
jgi:hypothetical protein